MNHTPSLVPDIIGPHAGGRVHVLCISLTEKTRKYIESTWVKVKFIHKSLLEVNTKFLYNSETPIAAILIGALERNDPSKLREILSFCMDKGIFMQKEINPEHPLLSHFKYPFRNLEIDELYDDSTPELPLQFDWEQERILVTGAAGSIGSELVDQLAQLNPAQLIIIDHAESPLYELCLQLEENHRWQRLIPILADVSDEARMQEIFKQYNPTRVYHTAACKQLPVVETNIREAIRVNILGTYILTKCAAAVQCHHFLMVSTDKSVDAISIMGATKRVAEQVLQLANLKSNMTCISTRFGNVLGSNGSVVPRFKKQIAQGGPVTITDSRMMRYFVSIGRACRLILQTSVLAGAEHTEVVIFDMGQPVPIEKLARMMIHLAGLRPGPDVRMVFTGLRPGEKLKEVLYLEKLKLEPTGIDCISRVVEEAVEPDLEISLIKLQDQFSTQSEGQFKSWLQYWVPSLSAKVK